MYDIRLYVSRMFCREADLERLGAALLGDLQRNQFHSSSDGITYSTPERSIAACRSETDAPKPDSDNIIVSNPPSEE